MVKHFQFKLAFFVYFSVYRNILTCGTASVAVVEFFIKYFWRRECFAIEEEEERNKIDYDFKEGRRIQDDA